jgi:hypothetical protein
VICTLSTELRFLRSSRQVFAKRNTSRFCTGLLGEIVTDAKDRRLIEHAVERRVERPRGDEIAAEGLFQNHARALRAGRATESVDHGRK